MIVCRPVRALEKLMLAAAVPDKDGVRSLTLAQTNQLRTYRTGPKHAIPTTA